jgi:hypothetical protein
MLTLMRAVIIPNSAMERRPHLGGWVKLGHPHTKVTPISPGMPPGQSMISNLILYPRGRK